MQVCHSIKRQSPLLAPCMPAGTGGVATIGTTGCGRGTPGQAPGGTPGVATAGMTTGTVDVLELELQLHLTGLSFSG
jgi:hypothetical protein